MKIVLLALLSVFVVSCSVNTPATRIEKNPQIYASLSERERSLIQNGQVEKGMTPQAVFLSWGAPDSKAQGQKDGKDFEKWSYTSLTPVYSQSFYGGFGFGSYGHYGCGRYGRRNFYPYHGIRTGVNYVPYRAAWVNFENGKVESWQRGRLD